MENQTKKYRTTIYLGKELYEQLTNLGKMMGLPLATVTKVILKTGMEFSQAIETNMVEGLKNGK